MRQKVLYCELSNSPPEKVLGTPVFSAITDEVTESLLNDPTYIAVVVELGVEGSTISEKPEDQGLLCTYLVCFVPGVTRAAMKFWPEKIKPDDVALSKSGIPWVVVFSSDDYRLASALQIALEIAEKFRAEAVVYTGPTGYEEMSEQTQPKPTLQ